MVYCYRFQYAWEYGKCYAGGIGKTRRIILTDTLLKQYTNEEIEIILAHELAHHKLRHRAPANFITGSSGVFHFLYNPHLSVLF